MYDVVERVIPASWLVLGQMAPYLLFGFLMAGVLSICISPAWVERHLGSAGFWPIFKAALFGVPLPLCSCSVIPVAASMRRHGASRASTTAFLLSTPQTGVDSIAVTYALLGPVFAVFRPLTALIIGLLGGAIVQSTDSSQSDDNEAPETPECHETCCSDGPSHGRLRRIITYGFVTLPADIGLALLVGVVIAGVISAYVQPDQLEPYFGSGFLSIVLAMIAGIPLYVCATASVPIAAGLMFAGVSPGAALAFLIAGPATNAAMLTTIWKLLGRRAAVLYLATVAIGAMVCGLTLNWLFTVVDLPLPLLGSHRHETDVVGLATHLWAVALLVVVGYSLVAKYRGTSEPH
jgi:uncharacterized membrane protein YraQ (UPF0718 family)